MDDTKEFFAPLLIAIEEERDFHCVWQICHQARAKGLFAIEAIEMLDDHKQDMFITDLQIQTIDKLIECLSGNADDALDLSDTQEQVLSHIAMLTAKYKYHKLPKKLSERSRALYLATLPRWVNANGDKTMLTTSIGTLICHEYDRVVIGDYGAYIEFDRTQTAKENICVKKGQEYRYKDPNYANQVKYFWYTTKDNSDAKIYFQQKEVTYADYKEKKLYVSPFECKPVKI